MESEEEHIRKIARVVLHELFEGVGVDMATPEGRKEFRENLDWVNSFRTGTNGMRTTAVGVGIASFVSGVIWLMWQGMKATVVAVKTMSGN